MVMFRRQSSGGGDIWNFPLEHWHSCSKVMFGLILSICLGDWWLPVVIAFYKSIGFAHQKLPCCVEMHARVVCMWWLFLKRPLPGHTLFKALLYLRQLSSVSSPFAIYDCPISVCHRTAVSISSIYPFSTCIQPRGIVKQIIVLILATFQVPIISDPVLTFTVQFGSQVMLRKLDMPSGVGFRLVGTFRAEHTYSFISVWIFMPRLMAFWTRFCATWAWLLAYSVVVCETGQPTSLSGALVF